MSKRLILWRSDHLSSFPCKNDDGAATYGRLSRLQPVPLPRAPKNSYTLQTPCRQFPNTNVCAMFQPSLCLEEKPQNSVFPVLSEFCLPQNLIHHFARTIFSTPSFFRILSTTQFSPPFVRILFTTEFSPPFVGILSTAEIYPSGILRIFVYHWILSAICQNLIISWCPALSNHASGGFPKWVPIPSSSPNCYV